MDCPDEVSDCMFKWRTSKGLCFVDPEVKIPAVLLVQRQLASAKTSFLNDLNQVF
jgi:hypothetical protein